MINTLTIFGSIVAAFGVFDLLVDQKRREALSDLIFGFEAISAQPIAQLQVEAVLDLFCRNGKVSLSKTAVWSFGVAPLLVSLDHHVVLFLGEASKLFLPEAEQKFSYAASIIRFADSQGFAFQLFLLKVALLALISVPLDYANFLITRSIYMNAPLGTPPADLFVRDASLSIGISAVLILSLVMIHPIIAAPLNDIKGWDDLNVVVISASASILISFSSILVFFALRISIFGISILLSTLSWATQIAQRLILFSNVYCYPFSFFGVLYAVLHLIIVGPTT